MAGGLTAVNGAARRARLVVVDVGNTSTAVGLWCGGRVSRVAHCDGGYDEAAEKVGELTRSPAAPTVLAYVSVVPSADARWRAFAESAGLDFRQVTHRCFDTPRFHSNIRPSAHSNIRPSAHSKIRTFENSNISLSLDYPKPETIGADRLADAVGAVSRYGAPVLVMDFGTALTAAVVTDDFVWRGGVIAPGFPLMRDYLFERTAKLPRLTLGRGGVPKIGRSTEEAMRFGALVGYRGMVREIVATLERNFACSFRLVATGGFAKWVLDGLDLPFTIDPTLTLYGAGLSCADTF